jgi:hypothetical protein
VGYWHTDQLNQRIVMLFHRYSPHYDFSFLAIRYFMAKGRVLLLASSLRHQQRAQARMQHRNQEVVEYCPSLQVVVLGY